MREFSDLLKLLGVCTNSDSILNSYNERKIARDKIKGLTISTCYTNDLGYETAIGDPDFYPVERYETKELAADGHKKWVKYIEDNKLPITIKTLRYGSLGEEKFISIGKQE